MGCGGSGGETPNPDNPTAVFDTSMGQFKAEIYLDKMPITASNFIDLAQSGFYNGLHFHDVVRRFYVQFGCPYSKDPNSEEYKRCGRGGPPENSGEYKHPLTGKTYERCGNKKNQIQDEFPPEQRISNLNYTLSMSNCGTPNSGGSQFFVNIGDNKQFDFWKDNKLVKHPVFGKISDGFILVSQISNVKTSDKNPETPIKMNSITIEYPKTQ